MLRLSAACLLVVSLFTASACATRESTVVRTVEFDDRSESWEGRTRVELEQVCGRPNSSGPDGSGGEVLAYTKVKEIYTEQPRTTQPGSIDPGGPGTLPPLMNDPLARSTYTVHTGRFWVNRNGVIYRVDAPSGCGKKKSKYAPPKPGTNVEGGFQGPAVISIGRLFEPSTEHFTKGTSFAIRPAGGFETAHSQATVERMLEHLSASLVARGFVASTESRATLLVSVWFGTDEMQVDLGMNDSEPAALYLHRFDIDAIEVEDGRTLWRGVARYNNLIAEDPTADSADHELGLFHVMAGSLLDLFGREGRDVVRLESEASFVGL